MKLNQVDKMKAPALKQYLHELILALNKEENNERGNNIFEGEPYNIFLEVPKSYTADEVLDMTVKEASDALKALIGALDDKDLDDAFGTQGWRYYLMGDD